MDDSQMPASLNPKLAFSTLGCPDWSWTEILTRGPNYGYQGVEIRLLRRETNLLEVAEFRAVDRARRRQELDEAGLAACGLASSVHFDEFDRNARAKELGVGRQYVDLARELGAGFIRVFGDVLPSEDGTRRGALEWIAEGIDSLAEYARAVDVQILLETHGDFSDSRNAAELMRLVSAPNAGILWDTHHPWRFLDEEIEESFVRMKPWVRHTHWKDSVSEPSDSKTNVTEVDCAGEKL
ncbi:MAG: sugar phosphate isomerase/epimerase family protein, partial [Planctomycetaceae bacterium]